MTIAVACLLFVAPGLFIAACAVLLSRAHLTRVERVTSGKTSDLAVALKRLPPPSRLAALRERAPSGSVESRLAEELTSAPDDAARLAVLGDVLAEIDLALDASAGWPSAATRIAVYGCLLLAALSLLARVGSFPAAALVIAGASAAAACVSIGERAKNRAREERKAVDALVDALVLRERAPAGKADRPRRAPR